MASPATFLEDCRQAGFEPARAMMFYSELRLFGAHQVGTNVPEEMKFFNAWSARSMAALKAVKTPADFDAYCRTSETRFDEALKDCGLGLGDVPSSTFSVVPRQELIARACGNLNPIGLPQWQDWEDQGMEWEDLRCVLKANKMDLDRYRRTRIPKGTTPEQALERLERLANDAGLGCLQWPWVQGTDTRDLWALGDQVQAASAEMANKTGWGAKALGLAGRVVLRLGLGDPAYASGFCCDWSSTAQLIETNPLVGWGPVAHEWMHAVDHTLHRLPTPAALEAWKGVHHNLNEAAWQKRDRKKMEALLETVLETSWADRPTVLSVLKELRHAETITPADHQRLGEAMAKDSLPLGDVDRADIRTVLALTELMLLREGLKDPSSLWTKYGQAFEKLAMEHLPPAKAQEWKDYFTSPEERVTHSFEATFAKKSITSDVVPNGSLRYPLGPEVKQHESAWKAFFQQTQSWYASVDPSFQIPATPVFPGISLQERRRAAQAAQVTPAPKASAPSLS
jgi:hypothetical protein